MWDVTEKNYKLLGDGGVTKRFSKCYLTGSGNDKILNVRTSWKNFR